MLIWGGASNVVHTVLLNDGARYDPTTNLWAPVTMVGAPSPRQSHTAIWTGHEMLIFDGGPVPMDGGQYDPATDTWTPIAPPGMLEPRGGYSVVWTGTEMIVWGGVRGGRLLANGARYNPATHAWAAISEVGAPDSRYGHSAVWTGTEMIVWGGALTAARGFTPLGGARYNPATDSWKPMAPNDRVGGRQAVWTGHEMLAGNGLATGRYDPEHDAWGPVSSDIGITYRSDATLIWTGKEAVYWGGHVRGNRTPEQFFADGARYDPDTDTWTPIPTTVEPSPRYRHTAVWTGTEMLIWGGDVGIPKADGWRYAPGWLTIRSPTTAYSIDDAPLFTAQPGERYRVVQADGDWVLVQWERDPPSWQEWIRRDDRVQISP